MRSSSSSSLHLHVLACFPGPPLLQLPSLIRRGEGEMAQQSNAPGKLCEDQQFSTHRHTQTQTYAKYKKKKISQEKREPTAKGRVEVKGEMRNGTGIEIVSKSRIRFIMQVYIFCTNNFNFVWGDVLLCYGPCRGQRTSCGSQFSPSSMWVPGIELGIRLEHRMPFTCRALSPPS